MSVTFDGLNRLIICNTGTTQLDVSKDLYSAWKDWASIGDNIKYPRAFRVVGGDPTVGGNSISGYFFLMNGWRVRPQEANHSLTVDGILLVDGGGEPFVNTLGTYNVRINMVTPMQAETVETGISGLTTEESDKLMGTPESSDIWSYDNRSLTEKTGFEISGTKTTLDDLNDISDSGIAGAVWDEDLTSHTTADSAGEIVSNTEFLTNRIRNIEEGNWKISGNQMIFYDVSGTEMFRYDLKDADGNPADENVYERQKV